MVSFYSNYKKEYIHIIAFISDKCNYNCDFCYNIKPRTNKFLDLKKLLIFLDDIYLKYNRKIFLELLGGEPTLHPDLLNFSNILKTKSYIEYYVFTNFSQDINYYLKLLQNNCALSITWHSKHNDITNKDFLNKLKYINLNYFDTPGIRLRILYEINYTKQSLEIFDELYHTYKKYLEFDILANINNKKFNYSVNQLTEYNNRTKLLKNAIDTDYIKNDNGKIQYFKFNEIVKHSNFNFKNWQCNAGKDCLYIHVNGNIYPCESYYFATAANVFNGIIGNLYDKTFKMLTRSTLCKCNECAWNWNILKKKVF